MSGLMQMPLGGVLDLVRGLVMGFFVLSAVLLIFVILLQEGKGGGLAGAFGGAGAEAFGVKAGTVNKFTSWLGAAFLGLALLHAGITTAVSAQFASGGAETPATEKYVEDDAGATAPGDESNGGDTGSGDAPADGPKDDGPEDPDGDG